MRRSGVRLLLPAPDFANNNAAYLMRRCCLYDAETCIVLVSMDMPHSTSPFIFLYGQQREQGCLTELLVRQTKALYISNKLSC